MNMFNIITINPFNHNNIGAYQFDAETYSCPFGG